MAMINGKTQEATSERYDWARREALDDLMIRNNPGLAVEHFGMASGLASELAGMIGQDRALWERRAETMATRSGEAMMRLLHG